MDPSTLKAVATIVILAIMAMWIIILNWRIDNLKIDKIELMIEKVLLKSRIDYLKDIVTHLM